MLKKSLWVTVFASSCVLAVNAAASSVQINLATGQASDGSIQTTPDNKDAFWTQSNANTPLDGSDPTATYTTGPGASDWYYQWAGNTPASTWIAPNPNNPSGNGAFTLTRTFDLTGLDLRTVKLSNGSWGIDDNGTLYLNGHVLSTLYGGSGSWQGLSSFSADPSFFLQGVNTLEMQMRYSDNYLEAARLEGTVTADALPSQNVPEPASLALLGIGSLGLAAWRRKSTQK